MFALDSLPFIETYVEELDEELNQRYSSRKLTKTQKRWLKYCLMGIILTNKICWAKFEQAGLGGYRSSLSWMFLWSKLPWEWLLVHSQT